MYVSLKLILVIKLYIFALSTLNY